MERLKVQFEESKDKRTGDSLSADLNQLTVDLVALKVAFHLYVCHFSSTSRGNYFIKSMN